MTSKLRMTAVLAIALAAAACATQATVTDDFPNTSPGGARTNGSSSSDSSDSDYEPPS